MKERNIAVILALATMLFLCTYSALGAEAPNGENTHQPAWFVLSVPAAAYLLLALIRSGELIDIRRRGHCRTG
jgi:hypothetical protein